MDTTMVKKYVVHPLAVGVGGAALTMALIGNPIGKVQAFGTRMRPVAVIGATVALGDLTAIIIGDQLKTLPQGQKLAQMEERVLAPILTGLSTVGVAMVFLSGVDGLKGAGKVFLLGASAEFAGDYLSDMVKPFF